MIVSKSPIVFAQSKSETQAALSMKRETKRQFFNSRYSYALSRRHNSNSEPEYSVDFEVTYQLGGDGKITYNAGVEAQDGNGNYGRVEVEKSADEKPVVKASGGHDSQGK